jgi:HlyD family secretion protein
MSILPNNGGQRMNSSRTEKSIDLQQLAVKRNPTQTTSIAPKRKWISRYVLPFGLLAGFAALLIGAAGERWRSRQPVTVMPVLARKIDGQRPGAILFQTPGWIEPRPSAIKVSALTSGTLKELLVVAGEAVEQGQVVARVLDTDILLQVEQSRNAIAVRAGELARAKAELDAAEKRLAQPMHLEVVLAEARSQLSKLKTQLSQLPFLIEAAETKADFAKRNWEAKQKASGSIPQRTINLAEQEYLTSNSELDELRNRMQTLETEVMALKDKEAILEKQLKLRIDEHQQRDESKAKVQTANALLEEAKLQLKQTELRLSRTEVKAPVNGRILSVVAVPGAGLGDSDIHGNSTVVEMYDPSRLQVRADVRLEDVPRLVPGQPVEIKTASAAGVLKGRLLQSTSQANIQRNTLEVKVELIDPPANVKPEMLVTASFLAPENLMRTDSDERSGLGLVIPTDLIQTKDDSHFVWIVAADNTARLQPIELGAATDDKLTEITAGIQITDKMVVGGHDQLTEGMRVVVTGEDNNMGK